MAILRYIEQHDAYVLSKANRIYVFRDANNVQELEPMPNQSSVVDMMMNRTGSMLIVLLEDKYLLVWDWNELQLVAHRATPRNALALTCAKYEADKECVIVGEKTGEAVAFPLPNVTDGTATLLQHTTSMITDVLMSKDDQFLITADRDEKIRVSNFPHTASSCLREENAVVARSISGVRGR